MNPLPLPPLHVRPHQFRFELERRGHRRARKLVKQRGNPSIGNLIRFADGDMHIAPHLLAMQWPALERESRRMGSSVIDPLARFQISFNSATEQRVYQTATRWVTHQLLSLSQTRTPLSVLNYSLNADLDKDCLESLREEAIIYHVNGFSGERDHTIVEALAIFHAIPVIMGRFDLPSSDSALLDVIKDMARMFIDVITESILESDCVEYMYRLLEPLFNASGKNIYMLEEFMRWVPVIAQQMLQNYAMVVGQTQQDYLSIALLHIGVV